MMDNGHPFAAGEGDGSLPGSGAGGGFGVFNGVEACERPRLPDVAGRAVTFGRNSALRQPGFAGEPNSKGTFR